MWILVVIVMVILTTGLIYVFKLNKKILVKKKKKLVC